MNKTELTVALIITTRNRKDDLGETLVELLNLGYQDIPIYIIDDASDVDIFDQNLISGFSRLEIRKNSSQKGLIYNRNQLANWAKEDILISLDDDSCFMSNYDLQELCDLFSSDPTLCAVEFDNYELGDGNKAVKNNGTFVQMYTGFGHAINRHVFLSLSGYRDYYIHMCEERDFGQRAWINGYHIEIFNKIKVLHRRTKTERYPDRNFYFLVRNTILFSMMNLFYTRGIFMPFYLLYGLTFWRESRGRKIIFAKAFFNAFFVLLKNVSHIKPMGFSAYIKFRKMEIR